MKDPLRRCATPPPEARGRRKAWLAEDGQAVATELIEHHFTAETLLDIFDAGAFNGEGVALFGDEGGEFVEGVESCLGFG